MWLIVVQLGQTEGLLAVAPRFILTAYTDFFGNYSLWILLSLDIIGNVLDLLQSNVPYPIQEQMGWVGVQVEEMGGGDGVGPGVGM